MLGHSINKNKAEKAEKSYRGPLYAYAVITGWRDPGTVRYMLDLEECPTGTGKLEAAEHIMAERLESCEHHDRRTTAIGQVKWRNDVRICQMMLRRKMSYHYSENRDGKR